MYTGTEAGRRRCCRRFETAKEYAARGQGAGRSRSHEGVTWCVRARRGHRRRRRHVHVGASPHSRRNLQPPPPCREAKRVAAGSRGFPLRLGAAEAGGIEPHGMNARLWFEPFGTWQPARTRVLADTDGLPARCLYQGPNLFRTKIARSNFSRAAEAVRNPGEE